MRRLRIPLYVQLLAWLALNLVLIGVLVYAFAAHNQTGWNRLLTQSVRDRLEAIGERVAADLDGVPESAWGPVLARHAAEDGVQGYSARRHGPPPMRGMPPGSGGPPDRGGPDSPIGREASNGIAAPDGDRATGRPAGPDGGRATSRAAGPNGGRAAGGIDSPPGQDRPIGAVSPDDPRVADHTGARPNLAPPFEGGPPVPPDQDLAGRGGPPGADARPRFIDIRRATDGAGFVVRIDAAPPIRGGPPGDIQITARVADTWTLLQLLGIGHEIAFLGAILLLSALLWWPFVWSMTRTIQQLLHATQQMSQGRLEVRVSETRRDELGELAVAVNSMAERLHTYLQGQRQFIADVAHEVISPIARMQIGLGILETHVPEKGNSALFDVREDLEQMAQMLDELLMFSRSGMESERTPLVSTPLLKVVEKVVATEADGANVSINIPPDMQVKARPAMLERALSNLVRNSRRYAATETIELFADRHGAAVHLSVRDRGPGVPESALARLGEPFFRPELSRTRTTGGFGLGLAIVRRCVATCNGEVHFRNRPGGGFEAEITLPAAA